MQNEYLKAIDIIGKAKYELSKIYDQGTTNTMENRRAYKSIERLIDLMEDVQADIEHFSKPVKEGVLREDSNQKFFIEFKDGNSSGSFGCGTPLEVYLEENEEEDISRGWYSGRVEHNGKGYYFYGPGNPMLYAGMKARVRK